VLPSKFLRFCNLVEKGIVKNWVTLGRWIEKDRFPPGILLGPNTRVWPEDQVEAWIAGRPERREDPPPAPVGAGGDGREFKLPSDIPSNKRIETPCQASSGGEEAA
jgi:predicted DNA-binding transcriptional regulator AlpA